MTTQVRLENREDEIKQIETRQSRKTAGVPSAALRIASLSQTVGNQGMIRLIQGGFFQRQVPTTPVSPLTITPDHIDGPLGPLLPDGPGTPLAPTVRSTLSDTLGVDVEPVRVHSDAASKALVDGLGARALTIGTHVLLGTNEQPNNLSLMAHEVAHVLQQQTALTPQGKNNAPSPSGLEREADAVALAVTQGQKVTVAGRAGGPRPQAAEANGGIIGGLWHAIGSAAQAAGELVGGIAERAAGFIKERARSIPGYDLLALILGRDPITTEPVARTAVNLLRAMTGLLPDGAEIYENLQKTGVLQRAFDWAQSELGRLNLTWPQIRDSVERFLQSLSVKDLADLDGVFARARAIFMPFIGSVAQFAVSAGRTLLELIFEGALALAGGAGARVLAFLRRAGSLFSLIVSDPVRFLRNLLHAVVSGFRLFAGNIVTHLKTALFEWLFGALQGAGLVLPEKWNLEGILSIVLQVLGLTYARLRDRLVRLLGERAVSAMESGFEFLQTLVTRGLAAAWQKILEFATGLVDSVIEGIRNWVITTIVKAAVARIAAMFNPVGAIINAIITIYNIVMFIVEKARQLAAFVGSVVNSLDRIAKGDVGAAAVFVERSLARILSLVISFLARLVGLGGISDTIRSIIKRVQTAVDHAIDKIVAWVGERARGLVRTGRKAVAGVVEWWKEHEPFKSRDGVAHTLFFVGEENSARLAFQSETTMLADFLASLTPSPSQRHLITDIRAEMTAIEKLKKTRPDKAAVRVSLKRIAELVAQLGEGSWGTEAQPLPLNYPKRPARLYRTLLIGPKTGKLVTQKELQSAERESAEKEEQWNWRRIIWNRIKPAERKEWKDRGLSILRFSPISPLPLPGGETIGITPAYQTEAGMKFRLIPNNTEGGHKINDALGHYGYSASAEKMDGDHVLEMQLGGPNKLENLWPLKASENRSSGASIARMAVPLPGGDERSMEELKELARKKKRTIWFFIAKTLPTTD